MAEIGPQPRWGQVWGYVRLCWSTRPPGEQASAAEQSVGRFGSEKGLIPRPGRLGCKLAPAPPLLLPSVPSALAAELQPVSTTSQVIADKPFLAAFTGFHGTTSALHRAAGEQPAQMPAGRSQRSCRAASAGDPQAAVAAWPAGSSFYDSQVQMFFVVALPCRCLPACFGWEGLPNASSWLPAARDLLTSAPPNQFKSIPRAGDPSTPQLGSRTHPRP